MNEQSWPMFGSAKACTFQNAKELRKEMTASENKLWDFLKIKPGGCKWRRQHPWSWYIADFYCHALKTVIEVDGGIHNDPVVKTNDDERQEMFEANGISVLRFTNDEITNQFEEVCQKIIHLTSTFKLTPR